MLSPELNIETDKAIGLKEPKADVRIQEKPFIKPEVEAYSFNAYHLAEALKLKEVSKLFDLKPAILNPTRLVYELSENCFCLIYNFGSIVFFHVDGEVQKTTLERLKNSLAKNNEPVAEDEFLLEVERRAKNRFSSPQGGREGEALSPRKRGGGGDVSPYNRVFFEKVVVDKLSREKIELVALVLAQSTALEYFENKVENTLSKLGVITAQMEDKGDTKLSEKEVRRFIGQAMATKQNLIGTLYLLEKPEETWDNKILDDLHQEAVMMFELKERFRTLDYKLKTIQENLEILSNYMTNRQHLSLEWAIVGLIVLEVALVCFEMFLKH